MSPAAEPRSGLRDVAPYAYTQLDVAARLNTNECPHPLPEGFFDELARAVHDLPLHRYPDGRMTRLREELAACAGHDLEGTWAANGSNEILTELLLAYGGPGRSALTFEPTYLLHSRLSWLTHTSVVQYRLQEPFTIGEQDVERAIALEPAVIFVCSPNNPTGNAQPVQAVRSLAERRDALVIVDEAYIEFGGQSALPLVADHPNVVIVRTLSKAFALAGARIGYCLAAPEVVEDLQRVRLPYHMSALAQAAGIAAIRHAPQAMSILQAVREQRDRIVEALCAAPGVEVFGSDANFVLFRPSKPAGEVWRGLLDRGVLVRDVTGAVPNGLRVTAGAAHEVDLFLHALSEVLS
ncbi:MAG: histidinol-phosphate transaminase [Actinobacteria bacterium]|nr:histidinol-phosphate transaminase [Actinomycetota bacterium]